MDLDAGDPIQYSRKVMNQSYVIVSVVAAVVLVLRVLVLRLEQPAHATVG